MIEKKIAIIGCGNLGRSILIGLLEQNNFPEQNIIVTKRNTQTLEEDFGNTNIEITTDNIYAVRNSDILLFALQPNDIAKEMSNLKDYINPEKHFIISTATGITIEDMLNALQIDMDVFRAMPNTAADVGQSVTCICSNTTDVSKYKTVKFFFDSIGRTIIVGESLMEASTILGACGIAFVLRFIRAMIQGGIQIGFDSETAGEIVNQTVLGAAQLLIERNQHPEFEIDKVTTPKGCTITGLNEMEHNGFSSALIKGIVSSYKAIEK